MLHCRNILNWLALASSITIEVVGSMCMRMSVIEYSPWFYVSIMFYIIAFMIFSKALECIPLDVAYALWSAAGTLITFIANHMLFEDTKTTASKIISLTFISLGCLGLIL